MRLVAHCEGRAMARILVVDDEANFLAVLGQVLTSKGHEVHLCGSVETALAETDGHPLDLAVTDLRMAPQSGMVLLERMRKERPALPVIVMTAYATVETALDALKIGAFDYVTKPFRLEAFLEVVDRALAAAAAEPTRLAGTDDLLRFGRVVCACPAMREACRMVELIAPTDAAVLLSGEAGTGRSLLATVVHELSRRSDGPFVTIDAADLPDDASPEAFLGEAPSPDDPPDKPAVGLLGAEGGSALIENVGRLTPALQTILLEALKDRRVPVAGKKVDLDVRFMATASGDLGPEAAAGGFLEELHRRLALVRVAIPALRDCPDAVLPLAQRFLESEVGPGNPIPELTGDARGVLLHYAWPGNAAELRSVLQQALRNLDDDRITRASFPRNVVDAVHGGEPADQLRPETQGKRQAAPSLKAFLKAQGVEPPPGSAAS